MSLAGRINALVADTATPPIPTAQAWARAYDGAGGPLIDLSQAVPGDPPHPDLIDRLAEGSRAPEAARYGPLAGDPRLREAYAAHVSTLYGAEIAADEVVITAGCNQAFFLTALTLARAGDAVMLPTPWYFNHQMTLAMLGVEPRPLPCSAASGFVPDPDEAERLIDDRLRAIVLVTPNNPTGAIYPPEIIARFRDLCRRRGLWLILDETYRDFLPDGAGRPHAVFEAPDWRDDVIQLYSFSKAYCIPGHRLGAMVVGRPLLPELGKVMDSLQICAPRPPQAALAWGLEGLAAWRAANRDEISNRACVFRDAIDGLPGWRLDALGAYFAYLRHPSGDTPSAVVAERLVKQRGVLCLPGDGFGAGQDGHLRFAFANTGALALGALRERLAGFS